MEVLAVLGGGKDPYSVVSPCCHVLCCDLPLCFVHCSACVCAVCVGTTSVIHKMQRLR
jgi:hypothetical protein